MNIIIGTKEILKAGKNLEKIIIAKNCPNEIREKLTTLNVKIEEFNGDEKELGIKIGKPFPVAAVGYIKSDENEN